jgi:cyclic beta-1,2-glucan synthetase
VSLTQHPAPDPAAHYRSSFHADRVCFEPDWPDLQTHTTVWVSPEDDIEFRQVELHNLGARTLDIELISAFEVTLADARADEAHPAFTNLFVKAELAGPRSRRWCSSAQPRLPPSTACRRRTSWPRAEAQVLGLRVQTDRQRWLGRNHDPASRWPLRRAAEPRRRQDAGRRWTPGWTRCAVLACVSCASPPAPRRS